MSSLAPLRVVCYVTQEGSRKRPKVTHRRGDQPGGAASRHVNNTRPRASRSSRRWNGFMWGGKRFKTRTQVKTGVHEEVQRSVKTYLSASRRTSSSSREKKKKKASGFPRHKSCLDPASSFPYCPFRGGNLQERKKKKKKKREETWNKTKFVRVPPLGSVSDESLARLDAVPVLFGSGYLCVGCALPDTLLQFLRLPCYRYVLVGQRLHNSS